jgi:hypothetical protein
VFIVIGLTISDLIKLFLESLIIMKPEELLSDINSESVIRIGHDECFTLTQFREIITTAVISMKVSYIQSLINQRYVSFVNTMDSSDRVLTDGRLANHEHTVYKDPYGEPYTVSDLHWFTSGEDCKILQPGETWQEGQFRLHVTAEFIPKDAPADRPIESSLDDFRGSLSS